MDYAVFDTLLDAVIVIDSARQIIYFNEMVTALCQVPRRKIKSGMFCHDLLKFESADLFCMPGGAWGEAEATAYREVRFTSVSGARGRVQVSIQPQGGGSAHWIIYLRDVALEEALHQKYRAELDQKERALTELKIAHEALEDYSKNLEKKVEERTLELRAANNLLNAILNSLGQAFFLFNRDGICQSVYSKACETILAIAPAGRPVTEVLRLAGHERDSFDQWRKMIFDERLPFEDLVELAPKWFAEGGQRRISLEYYSMRADSGSLEGVVMVGTDKTSEYQANLSAARDRAYVEMVIRIVKFRSQFLTYARETLRNLQSMRDGVFERITALRFLHTIKGGSAMFNVGDLASIAHEAETSLGTQSDKATLLLWLEKIENELTRFFRRNRDIIGRDLGDFGPRSEVSTDALMKFRSSLASLSGHETLQAEFSEQFIKEPVQRSFSHFDEMIADLAVKQAKCVAPLSIRGGDLRIFSDAYSDLFSSFVHAFRNAVDHGLETPDERAKLGKASAGTIVLEFSRAVKDDGGWLIIRVRDDGRGIDPDIIRKKLAGASRPNESDEEVIQHVFDSGISTSASVNMTSGRGVGMGAILAEAKKLGGSACVQSDVGKGTTLIVSVPEINPA